MRIRVFLDANVLFLAAHAEKRSFIAAASSPPRQDGLARSLWAHVGPRGIELMTVDLALVEARSNLIRKGPDGAPERLDALLARVTVLPGSIARWRAELGLPESDHLILSAAIHARAQYFLTGDRRHFGPLLGLSVGGVRLMAIRNFVTDILSR